MSDRHEVRAREIVNTCCDQTKKYQVQYVAEALRKEREEALDEAIYAVSVGYHNTATMSHEKTHCETLVETLRRLKENSK